MGFHVPAAALESGDSPERIYNLGSGHGVSVFEIMPASACQAWEQVMAGLAVALQAQAYRRSPLEPGPQDARVQSVAGTRLSAWSARVLSRRFSWIGCEQATARTYPVSWSSQYSRRAR